MKSSSFNLFQVQENMTSVLAGRSYGICIVNILKGIALSAKNRFEYILDKHNLKVRKKKRKPRTTDSRHGLPTYPNQAKSYIPTQANRLWVSDITYIPIHVNESKHIFCYLSLILDAYSKEIVGWAVGETLETSHCIHAFRMALKRVDVTSGKGLIHHSDRGCQYASKEYTSLLREYGITISMTEDGNPKDNAQAERINNTIKNELLRVSLFVISRRLEKL